MDSPWHVGDDDRDVLGADYEAGACPDCGAYPSEPCEKDCACGFCVARRRDAATTKGAA